MAIVQIDVNRITDWDSFHDVFAETFGFPKYYGRNMNAWIDCMTYLNDPEGSDSAFQCEKNKIVFLDLVGMHDLKKRNPEIYDALIESSAFVNYRRIDVGENPVLGLSFWATDPRK